MLYLKKKPAKYLLKKIYWLIYNNTLVVITLTELNSFDFYSRLIYYP